MPVNGFNKNQSAPNSVRPFSGRRAPVAYTRLRPGSYAIDLYLGDASGDFPDNHIRFAVLTRAALEISRLLFQANVFHCHDWQASLLPVYLRNTLADEPRFASAKVQ